MTVIDRRIASAISNRRHADQAKFSWIFLFDLSEALERGDISLHLETAEDGTLYLTCLRNCPDTLFHGLERSAGRVREIRIPVSVSGPDCQQDSESGG